MGMQLLVSLFILCKALTSAWMRRRDRPYLLSSFLFSSALKCYSLGRYIIISTIDKFPENEMTSVVCT